MHDFDSRFRRCSLQGFLIHHCLLTPRIPLLLDTLHNDTIPIHSTPILALLAARPRPRPTPALPLIRQRPANIRRRKMRAPPFARLSGSLTALALVDSIDAELLSNFRDFGVVAGVAHAVAPAYFTVMEEEFAADLGVIAAGEHFAAGHDALDGGLEGEEEKGLVHILGCLRSKV